MQATGQTVIDIGASAQARQLVRTIVDAATALARLLPQNSNGDSNSPGGILIPDEIRFV